ncbi:Aste57867_2439 [Aphanomyces stellatus]|uniref:Aste57867_2439 protein n=1 Tax=Aphanomyces stellatus TaxID=120398 RepID=A0A485K7N7_9STRA|nr:hypothetical protein As57867_002433 [Aphanomyces stellatus]VFT79640.1 Aste57867_2439 [Aphanomyces stellatus]
MLAKTRLLAQPALVLLGSTEHARLPIVSFMVRYQDRFLHYNFVCALLNDLFGIQSRGGCMCAAPYSHRLMGIAAKTNQEFAAAICQGAAVLRPGYTRLSLPYFMSKLQVDYILAAVEFVAVNGWRFLPQYNFNQSTGEWVHKRGVTSSPECLQDLQLNSPTPSTTRSDYTLLLDQAATLAQTSQVHLAPLQMAPLPTPIEHLRWFVYPWEAVQDLLNIRSMVVLRPLRCPVLPKVSGIEPRPTNTGQKRQHWFHLVWNTKRGVKHQLPNLEDEQEVDNTSASTEWGLSI